MAYGFIKAACVSPHLKVAECCFNAEKIVEAAEAAAGKGAAVIVFPELSITSYTCGDLFSACFAKVSRETAFHDYRKNF